ncbi:reverse transcriptase domain-containing protein [Tanacetum coccineum]
MNFSMIKNLTYRISMSLVLSAIPLMIVKTLLTAMASEQFSSGPGPKLMTPGTISSKQYRFLLDINYKMKPYSAILMLSFLPLNPRVIKKHIWNPIGLELNEFERLEVWELVRRPDRVMITTLKWIYKVKLDELGDADHVGCQDTRKSTSRSMQLLGNRYSLKDKNKAKKDKTEHEIGKSRDDPHSHIRWFNKITSTLKYKNVPHEVIKLMLFPFSLEGATRIWLEKEPPRSIHTWEDLVSKFVNYFFPPSKTTNLKNDIMNFQQRFDETFSEAWDRFKDLLCKCPHHDFLELHQIDMFYNALTQSDQDSLNAAAGGNLLNCTPRDSLTIIKNKSKVHTSRNKPVVSKASATSSSTPDYLPEITALTDAVKAMLLQNKTPSPAPDKAIEEICVTCGGLHPYYECLATEGNTFNASAATGTYNQGGLGYRPREETNYRASNQMRPPGFPQPNVQNNQNQYNQNQGYNQNRGNNFNQGNQNYQALFNQTQVGPLNDFSNYIKTNDVNMRAMQNQINNIKAEFKNEVQTTIRNQSNELKNDIKNMMNSFFQMNSPSGLGSLPSNAIANPRGDLKAITTRSGVSYDGPTIPPTSSPLLKEVEREPKVTKDKLDECLALADLGASINLMPLSVWKKLSLPELTLTRMTHELVNRSVAYPIGVAEDVSLILERPFIRTVRALIDVHGEELTLRVNDKAITFNFKHTSRYSYRYDDESVNRIDVIDVTCEEYAQEVLGFLDSSKSGNPTPSLDPIIATSSPSLTPFEGGDFVLEEIKACLTSDSFPSGIDDDDFDPEGDILLLEKLLNDDPSSPLPLKELNFEELKIIKSSIDDPPELELKDLPSHLKYAFLEGTNKLHVIIAKNLKDDEKARLLKVPKSHKRAIAWKITDIKGINP